MAENHMEQVAKMFGKKLNEPFVARFMREDSIYEFSKDGINEIYKGIKYGDPYVLEALLTGEVEIVEGEE